MAGTDTSQVIVAAINTVLFYPLLFFLSHPPLSCDSLLTGWLIGLLPMLPSLTWTRLVGFSSDPAVIRQQYPLFLTDPFPAVLTPFPLF